MTSLSRSPSAPCSMLSRCTAQILPRRTSAGCAAVSSSPGSGMNSELRSASTGAVAGVLKRLGVSWTNNGFAVSPDGRYVYFTLIPKSRKWKSLLLEPLSVATDRTRFMAFGEQPAVSPDGRLLAYTSGEDRMATVVVREAASPVAASARSAHPGSKDPLHLLVISVTQPVTLTARQVALPGAMEIRAASVRARPRPTHSL
jgi:WD40-like Beta Propeller Repeat